MVRPREFDEQTVLDAAKQVFWATGYAGTSVGTIAAATGLGKGSLYGAFGDKHALFLRVFGDYCSRVAEHACKALTGPDSEALSRLSSYVTRVAEDTACDREHRGCLLAKGVAELAEHDPGVIAGARHTFTTVETALTRAVEAAQRHGDIAATANAEGLALMLLALVRGIEALGKAGEDPDRLKTIAKTALSVLPRPV